MKKVYYLILTVILAAGLAGCGPAFSGAGSGSVRREKNGSSSEESAESDHKGFIYYLDSGEDEIVKIPYSFSEPDEDGRIVELIAMQIQDPPRNGLKSLLPDGVRITDYDVDNKNLTLDLSGDVNSLAASRRTLMICGLARTFLEIQDLDSVSFTVDGSPLEDSYGSDIGALTRTSFVENPGENINSYKYTTMTLYFADETGTHLVPEEKRVYYISSEPVERALIEELIHGPEETGHSAVLPSDTNLLTITTQDGVCYVNFDDSVRNPIPSVSEEVALYSIVDSLIDTIPEISRVQISVNGDNHGVFRQNLKLNTQYTKKDMTGG